MPDKEISALTAASAFADADLFHVSQGGNSRKASMSGLKTYMPGRLIGIQTITATGAGIYTPTSGTTSIVIEMVGGGGGGSGVASSTTSNIGVGCSGSGGAYLRKRLTANFSGASYSVGAKGAGGAAGANNGANGGDTTFTDTAGSPTVYTAAGGVGGPGRATGVPVQVAGGSAGGAATNGDINITGGPSAAGVGFAGPFYTITGQGGSSHFSGGANGLVIAGNPTSSAGLNAAGKGGGGSGAAANGNNPGARAGGDGSDGMLIIWEYG